jgi:hypothetical protein
MVCLILEILFTVGLVVVVAVIGLFLFLISDIPCRRLQ